MDLVCCLETNSSRNTPPLSTSNHTQLSTVAPILRKGDDAVDATKGTKGEYRNARGHHVHGQSGFKHTAKYNKYEGFSISQQYMKSRGWSHQAMTNKQRELFNELAKSGRPNTMAEHTRIAVEALQAGGATLAEARALVAESLYNLRRQGVTVPSHIPWN